MRVTYYIADLKRDPNLKNYPNMDSALVLYQIASHTASSTCSREASV